MARRRCQARERNIILRSVVMPIFAFNVVDGITIMHLMHYTLRALAVHTGNCIVIAILMQTCRPVELIIMLRLIAPPLNHRENWDGRKIDQQNSTLHIMADFGRPQKIIANENPTCRSTRNHNTTYFQS